MCLPSTFQYSADSFLHKPFQHTANKLAPVRLKIWFPGSPAAQQIGHISCLFFMKTLYCFLATALFLASCNAPRYVYSPSVTNTAMASGAGDTHLDLYASNSGNGVGLNLAGNYAIGKNFGIGGQYYYTGDQSSGSDDFIGGTPPQVDISYNRQMAAVQAFFFLPLGKSENIFAELAAGYGSGRYELRDVQRFSSGTVQTYAHDAKATHAMAHAAFYGVLGNDRNIKLGASMRFNSVRYRDISTNYSPVQLASYRLDSLSFRAINFLEPALTFRYMFTEIPLQVTAQAGVSARLNRPVVDFRNQHFSLGVGYAFARKRVKK